MVYSIELLGGRVCFAVTIVRPLKDEDEDDNSSSDLVSVVGSESLAPEVNILKAMGFVRW